jgi:AcrR family transcriptional regulator
MANGAETRIRRSREKILAAAENIFLRHGFLGTNMDNVADQANVSKQTVYAHFGSKEALFIDVVETMTGGASHKLGEDRKEIFDERSAAVYFLEAAIDQLTVVMTPRLMRLRRLVIGEVERFPELGKSLYLNGPKRSIERLAHACEHYTSTGELDTPDPHKAATQFNWILMGAPTNAAMLLGDDGIPDQKQLREHAHEAVRIFLRAYAV